MPPFPTLFSKVLLLPPFLPCSQRSQFCHHFLPCSQRSRFCHHFLPCSLRSQFYHHVLPCSQRSCFCHHFLPCSQRPQLSTISYHVLKAPSTFISYPVLKGPNSATISKSVLKRPTHRCKMGGGGGVIYTRGKITSPKPLAPLTHHPYKEKLKPLCPPPHGIILSPLPPLNLSTPNSKCPTLKLPQSIQTWQRLNLCRSLTQP